MSRRTRDMGHPGDFHYAVNAAINGRSSTVKNELISCGKGPASAKGAEEWATRQIQHYLPRVPPCIRLYSGSFHLRPSKFIVTEKSIGSQSLADIRTSNLNGPGPTSALHL